MDRKTLSLPVSNSQFYTAAVASLSMLTPIAQTPVEKDENDIVSVTASMLTINPNTAVYELTEEVKKLILKFDTQFIYFLFLNSNQE